MAGPIRTNIREVRRDLKRLEPEGTWKPEMKEAGLAAADVVAEETRSNAQRGATTAAGTHATMGSAAISSIRSQASARGASVALGQGPSRRYAPQWNFGGRARQFPRPTAPDYALYRALASKGDEVVRVYREHMDRLLKRFTF